MSDVHFIGNFAHFFHKAAKRLALNFFWHGVHNGAKLGTIAVCNIGEQLGTLSFLESVVSSLKDDGRIGCCQVPRIGNGTRVVDDLNSTCQYNGCVKTRIE